MAQRIQAWNMAKNDLRAETETDETIALEVEAIARILEFRRYFTEHVYANEAAQILHRDGIRFVPSAVIDPMVKIRGDNLPRTPDQTPEQQQMAQLGQGMSDLQETMKLFLMTQMDPNTRPPAPPRVDDKPETDTGASESQ